MFITHQAARRIRISSAVVATYLIGVAILVMAFAAQGAELRSAHGSWMLAVPVGFIAYISFEFFAAWALRQPMLQHVPAALRMPLLVAVFCAAMIAFAYFGDAQFTVSVGGT